MQKKITGTLKDNEIRSKSNCKKNQNLRILHTANLKDKKGTFLVGHNKPCAFS